MLEHNFVAFLLPICLIAGCNYGYAFYTSKESARALMDTVNMREMLGSTIKITPARSTAESFQQFNIGQATLSKRKEICCKLLINFLNI